MKTAYNKRNFAMGGGFLRGFTMIELIFVIVILGVLAAVAIPKLNATRDDAMRVKQAQNIKTLITDLASYYMAHGSFQVDKNGYVNLHAATNIRGDDGSQEIFYYFDAPGSKRCFGIWMQVPQGANPQVGIMYADKRAPKPCQDFVEFLKTHESIDITNADNITKMIL